MPCFRFSGTELEGTFSSFLEFSCPLSLDALLRCLMRRDLPPAIRAVSEEQGVMIIWTGEDEADVVTSYVTTNMLAEVCCTVIRGFPKSVEVL